MNLVFFGIQGSGKGTQAKNLAKEFGFTIFETGGELRNLAKEESDLGKKVKTTIEAGQLVSSELVMEIVRNFLKNHTGEKIIFDGIPRNAEQYDMLQQVFEDYGLEAIGVHFVLTKEEAMIRLMKRAQIEGRADDNEESIKKRIEIFYDQTEPIINKFKEKGKLVEINGEPPIETVYETLKTTLKNNGNLN
jgi:adenylate kinase